jgi:hypothetical protein
MEPEAQLIAAQAAEELARQQATGQIDEIQRGRMAQQILGGAAQQAQAREAASAAKAFSEGDRLGRSIYELNFEKKQQDRARDLKNLMNKLDIGASVGSVASKTVADYLAELENQEILEKGLFEAARATTAKDNQIMNFLKKNPQAQFSSNILNKAESMIPAVAMSREMDAMDAARKRFAQSQQDLRGFSRAKGVPVQQSIYDLPPTLSTPFADELVNQRLQDRLLDLMAYGDFDQL